MILQGQGLELTTPRRFWQKHSRWAGSPYTSFQEEKFGKRMVGREVGAGPTWTSGCIPSMVHEPGAGLCCPAREGRWCYSHPWWGTLREKVPHASMAGLEKENKTRTGRLCIINLKQMMHFSWWIQKQMSLEIAKCEAFKSIALWLKVINMHCSDVNNTISYTRKLLRQ